MKNDFVFWVPKVAGPNKDDGTAGPMVDGKEFEMVIDNLRLVIDKVTVEDRIFNFYFNGLKKVPEIPFSRNMVRSYTKLAGSTDLGCQNLIESNQLPEFALVVRLSLF